MIASNTDRHKFIGGSESKYVDMNYETMTFRKWWRNKLLARTPKGFSTYATELGNLLEHEISRAAKMHSLDAVDHKEGTIARVNLDGLKGDHAIGEIKTAKVTIVHKWLKTKKRDTDTAYRKQARHAMYVTGRKHAEIAVLPLTEFDYANPMKIIINPLKLVWFNYKWEDFDMEEYDQRIKYLTHCYKNYLIPQNEGWREIF